MISFTQTVLTQATQRLVSTSLSYPYLTESLYMYMRSAPRTTTYIHVWYNEPSRTNPTSKVILRGHTDKKVGTGANHLTYSTSPTFNNSKLLLSHG